MGRAVRFAAIAAIGLGVVLLPYWMAIIQHPIEQIPIPHASRSNLLLNLNYAINYFFMPYGALLLASHSCFGWIGGPPTTSADAGLLDYVPVRTGRNNSCPQVDLSQGL